MNITPINSYSNNTVSPLFKANLHVEKSVAPIIESNKQTFVKAAERFDEWLRTEKGHIAATMTIRANTALNPKVAFEHIINEISHAYPHEETGHEITRLQKEYENLEFEMGNLKYGFWLDKSKNENDLLGYFKNMFNNMEKGL